MSQWFGGDAGLQRWCGSDGRRVGQLEGRSSELLVCRGKNKLLTLLTVHGFTDCFKVLLWPRGTVTQVSPRNCLFRLPMKQEWCRVGGVFLSKVRSVDTVTVGPGNAACKPVQSSLPQGHPLPGPSRQVSAGAPLRGERLGAPADGGTLRGHLQPPELPRRFRWVLRRPGDGCGSLRPTEAAVFRGPEQSFRSPVLPG